MVYEITFKGVPEPEYVAAKNFVFQGGGVAFLSPEGPLSHWYPLDRIERIRPTAPVPQ